MRTGAFRERVEEQRVAYGLEDEDAFVAHAIALLLKRLKKPGELLSAPAVVKNYLRLSLTAQEHESFVVLFLDSKNRLIESQELFRGTLSSATVYPREVVKSALQCNACSVILAHNHPSGVPDPSAADKLLTTTLVQALTLIDVRVLDHIIVAGASTYSFAENGDL